MKIAIWVLTGLVLLLGTAVVGVASWAANWVAASGEQVARGARSAADVIASLELPRWLAWLDPSWVQPLQEAMLWSANVLLAASPWIGPLLGWIAPALWVGWLLVALAIVAVAAVLHHLAGRLARVEAEVRGPR